MIRFSVLYQPTTLFSLKDSNSTNSGAKSLLIPSPYAIKMAFLNQAITIGGIDFEIGGKKNEWFKIIRDSKITFRVSGDFCVNNCFIKILKPSRAISGQVQKTVSFREYIFIGKPIEIIFSVETEDAKLFLQQYLHRINYFGKRGCFFQFLNYNENPNEPNVNVFDSDNLTHGILQQYDDFGEKFAFEDVNNYGGKTSVKRAKEILVLPVFRRSSSKSYTLYQVKP